jgi:hypothetical protein
LRGANCRALRFPDRNVSRFTCAASLPSYVVEGSKPRASSRRRCVERAQTPFIHGGFNVEQVSQACHGDDRSRLAVERRADFISFRVVTVLLQGRNPRHERICLSFAQDQARRTNLQNIKSDRLAVSGTRDNFFAVMTCVGKVVVVMVSGDPGTNGNPLAQELFDNVRRETCIDGC